jgi:DHA1 family bicyclomycin/chloramphenicol resistance-like MFS transporter
MSTSSAEALPGIVSSSDRAAYYRLGLILGALTAMGPLAIDMYLPSFPTIARELQATPASVQVTAAVYFVGLAVGQALYGPLSDRLGRKIPLYVGLIVFVTASIGCAFAGSVRSLIVLRFVQALGGCAEMVVARAVVRDRFAVSDAIKVLSLLMLVMGLAPILAPLIGGQLLVKFGWRSVFLVLAAYGALGLLVVIGWLPESLPPSRRHVGGVDAILAGFHVLLKDRLYLAYALVGGLTIAAMFAYIAASPFVFIEVFHVAPERYGLFFGTNAFGIITASQINGRLAPRIGPEGVLTRVLPVIMVAGLVLVTSAFTGFGGFAGILVPLFVCVASVGFVMPNTTVLAMDPHARIAGSASALLGTLQFLLGAASGGLASALADGTPRPLAVVIAACGAGAFAIYRSRPRPKAVARGAA